MNIEVMDISFLKQAYSNDELNPEELVENILKRAQEFSDYNIWIHLLTLDELKPYLENLKKLSKTEAPLWGVPFAIKDNIDLAGIPTTAACPDFEYIPERSAFVVEKLIEAGAIPIGKTNLDQFATGLVGTRSPYGACKNSINPEMISGGSSSGSAVAVGLGLVSFSLGTDTAGSGRVPAFLNNLVGVKPTLGCLSATGMVPACRTLDTISIFTNDTEDATTVFKVASTFDEEDDYARPFVATERFNESLTIGVPKPEYLNWFGNEESSTLFENAIEALKKLGHEIKLIDFAPFIETANLLYYGPWVAERYAALEDLMDNKPSALHPVTFKVVDQAKGYSAVDTFKAMYQLKSLKKAADKIISSVDCVVTPSAGTYYTIKDLEQDPIQLNTNLGYYTNFMNLLDYSALAIPSGHYQNGMPFGITLFAPAFSDLELLSVATLFEKQQMENNNE
jgi:allophanate hydrolase